MAVAPTGAIYKALSFDNVSSRTYGVYITGQAVYNAPTRDVEMISIPGRNGAFALDKGRFENIEVSYPAGIFADNETDFAEAISDFRNFLCSRNGYVRLTDEYNPNEYRMAIYKSGLEVTPAQLKAGEFEIIFDCKPQRWLTSGETAVTVANNGTLTNPTLFESSPMLEVTGYGTLEFNGYEIELENATMGDVPIADAFTGNISQGGGISHTLHADRLLFTLTDDIKAKFNSADVITIPAFTVNILRVGGSSDNVVSLTKVSDSLTGATTTVSSASDYPYGTNVKRYNIAVSMPSCTIPINISTNSNIISNQTTFTAVTSSSVTEVLTTQITYTSYNKQVRLNLSFDENSSILYVWNYPKGFECAIGAITGYSTISILGNPTYIDCDLGEAYMIRSGEMVSLNQYIDLGSDLPILSPGSNTITFDNTITKLEIKPRWWKV